jgi:hypothetical protein
MPLKSALKYPVYRFVDVPMIVQIAFPGNIGEGISSDAIVNIRKKTTRISDPLIANHP